MVSTSRFTQNIGLIICKWNIGFGYDTFTQFPLNIERGTAGYLLISTVQAVHDCYLLFRLQKELHKQKARWKSISINSFLRDGHFIVNPQKDSNDLLSQPRPDHGLRRVPAALWLL